MASNQALASLHGFEVDGGLVGGNVDADAIPELGELAEGSEVEDGVEESEVAVPDVNQVQAEIQQNIMNGLYVKDGAAYSIYYFAQGAVERYAQVINTAAERLKGKTQVYSILVPNNSGALLEEDELAGLGGSDQRQAIKYFYSLYDDEVISVDIYDALRDHRDEYLYFRADHHWTQLGAYYAYKEYCKAAGLFPADIKHDWERVVYEPFLGSFYTQLGRADMAANPDYVEAWIPPSTNDCTIWQKDGTESKGKVILDTTTWNVNAKNLCFIQGDNSLTLIENPILENGRKCLVVKESFGDPFAALLVENYETIWVIDFRYSERDICDFCVEKGITDLIFMNNVSMAGTDPVSKMLLAEVS